MSEFPTTAELLQATDTAAAKTAFEKILLATRQLAGAQPRETLTVSGGVITPTRCAVIVDTEAAAETDDLATILTTNLPDGSWLFLGLVNAGRVVTLKHGAGGVGQMLMVDGADVALENTGDLVGFQRVGTSWLEMMRTGPSFGYEPADPDILKADTPDILQTLYGDEAQTITGTALTGLTVSRNHLKWTLTGNATFDDITLPAGWTGTLVFHVYPGGYSLTMAASYKTDGTLATPDPSAGEIRITVEIFNGRKTIVSLQNVEA
jgi:hypothetical protein